jgi:Zn-dependent protease with chaperone function
MIDAHFYDGDSARRHAVTVIVHGRVLAMRGAGGLQRSARLSRMRVSERLAHGPRLLHFADGGHLEVYATGLDALLQANGYREPRVVRWQHQSRAALGALLLTVAVLLTGYQWGLPWGADQLAQQLPRALEVRLGDSAIAAMEKDGTLLPSTLPEAQQDWLRAAFGALHQPRGELTAYRLLFRSGRIGINAFALPNGVIVVSDALVRLADSDSAVLAVLAHELGHVQRRHALRGMLQTAGVGMALSVTLGDLSSLIAAAPALLIGQSYSRDFEREADRYAIDMMRANQMRLTPMAELFERMHRPGAGMLKAAATLPQEGDGDDEEEERAQRPPVRQQRGGKDDEPEEAPDYFSSHPSDRERIATLREADKQP